MYTPSTVIRVPRRPSFCQPCASALFAVSSTMLISGTGDSAATSGRRFKSCPATSKKPCNDRMSVWSVGAERNRIEIPLCLGGSRGVENGCFGRFLLMFPWP